MAITPIAATGKLRIKYEVGELLHHIDFFVDVDETTPDNWLILPNPGAVISATGGAVGQIFWDLVRPLFPTSTPAPTWELFQRDVNIYIPRDGGALTGAGTAISAYKTAAQATLTFRNASQVLLRMQLMETVLGYPDSRPLPTTEPNIIALTNSMIEAPDDANLASYIKARGLGANFSARFFSSDINQKIRRARGV
jgi:hypothetical protein